MIELFEHNKTAYAAACRLLAETGKACVIHPTGTGKSFIAFKWAEDNPQKRLLWLGPSENIFDTQLENLRRVSDLEPENLRFMTYARLANLPDEALDALQPDCICLDEAHRAGARVWSAGVERLLRACPRALLLGLTATPIRYLDARRDMSQELFDGCVADSLSLGEAIARGILPAPKYVVSLYASGGFDRQLDAYRDRIRRSGAASRAQAERCLDGLRRALERAEGLDRVFEKHLKRGKYLVFCASVAQLRALEQKVPEWFDGVDAAPHVYGVWADSASAKADYAAFRADDSDHLRLLFCVDMFNEGIHVEGIDGVILFRPTVSPIIYKQQIGRALSALKDGAPLIIDAVNNFEGLYSVSAIRAELREVVRTVRQCREDADTDVFEVIDEVRECRRLIDRLEETLALSWDMMYREAEAYARTHGTLDLPRRYRTPEGIPLGQWVHSQRAIYNGDRAGLLDDDRVARLEAIGMRWSSVRESRWENGFAHAEAYRAQFGNLAVPSKYVSDDGFRLGAWISAQRSACAKREDSTEDERFGRLEALGMVWSRADAAFEEGLAEAARYAAEHGDLDVPAHYVTPGGYRLGAWISRIRACRRDGAALEADRVARLEALGMRWEDRQEQRWEACFAEAARYYAAHGDLAVPADDGGSGVRLDRWLQRQRAEARQGRLAPEKLARLEKIGFTVVARSKTWDAHLEMARAYRAAHGNLDVPADYRAVNGTWLGRWLANQRQDRVDGKLTPEQIARLDALGMPWEDARRTRWNACVDTVRAYPRTAAGVPIVPADARSEFGTKLKPWVETQDRRYRSGQLTPAQSAKWEELLSESQPRAVAR